MLTPPYKYIYIFKFLTHLQFIIEPYNAAWQRGELLF